MKLDLQSLLQNKEILNNVIASVVLLGTILLLRILIVRAIANSKVIPREYRRQWMVNIKTASLFLLLFGFLIIWASELQNFAISLVAVAAAIVIALKEVIVNISGYFSRVSANPFSIGDRIEVNGVRGDVVDQNLFFTKLLEIGPGSVTNQYTGRSVNLPNATFLSQNIINESFTDSFTLHVFKVPLLVNEHLLFYQDSLLEACEKHCSPFLKEAEKAFRTFGTKQGLEPPSVEPRVHYRFFDKDTVELVARIPAPIGRKGRIEQEILKDFAQKFVSTLEERKESPE